MLKISDLAFSYSGNGCKVFNDFSLSFEKGAVYGLLGLNGTGKSTLLYLLTGLLRPQQGSVLYKGEDVQMRLPSTLSDMFIVPEEFELPKMSIKRYAALHAGFYPRFSYEQLQKNLAMFGLDDSVVFNNLSMGQQKKAFMCYALATNTSLLVMDEPTNGLDIPSKSEFRRLIASNMAEEKTIIISTHQVRDIDSLLDHIVIIDHRGLVLDAPTYEISSRLRFSVEADAEGAFYSQPSLGGYSTVRENTTAEESSIDIEMLFGAATSAPAELKRILNPSTK